MATTSYSNLFGTNGSGYGANTGSKAGISTLYGQQAKPKRPQADGSVMAPAPTFAQLQSSGQARPAPQAPEMTQPYQQPYQQPSQGGWYGAAMASPYQGGGASAYGDRGGSTYTPTYTPPPPPAPPSDSGDSSGGDFMSRVKSALSGEGSVPSSRYDLPLFQQLRDFQRTQLESEFGAARQGLEEEMARRGLASSSIASGRYGDLAGQQARAMAGVDIGLLQKAADAAAEDRRSRDAMRIQLAQILSQVDPGNLETIKKQLSSLGLFDTDSYQRRP